MTPLEKSDTCMLVFYVEGIYLPVRMRKFAIDILDTKFDFLRSLDIYMLYIDRKMKIWTKLHNNLLNLTGKRRHRNCLIG